MDCEWCKQPMVGAHKNRRYHPACKRENAREYQRIRARTRRRPSRARAIKRGSKLRRCLVCEQLFVGDLATYACEGCIQAGDRDSLAAS